MIKPATDMNAAQNSSANAAQNSIDSTKKANQPVETISSKAKKLFYKALFQISEEAKDLGKVGFKTLPYSILSTLILGFRQQARLVSHETLIRANELVLGIAFLGMLVKTSMTLVNTIESVAKERERQKNQATIAGRTIQPQTTSDGRVLEKSVLKKTD